ncbi:collagenase [Streptomyces sp. NPDC087300]|uniref:collagenase n=1 Tax=Streptomyces sp. NPDC087300 TaxID=3365780 RepID=UPI0037F427EC
MKPRSSALRERARILIAALIACLGMALIAPASPAGAATGARPERTAPGSSAPAPDPAPLPATPSRATAEAQRADEPAEDVANRPPMQAAPDKSRLGKGRIKAAECRVSDFTSKTGAALVQQIKSVDVTCVNTLFSVTGPDARALFREAQMVTVADALRDTAAGYPGDNSTSAEQVVLYLRAGYYVQWGDPDGVGAYGPALKSAIQGGLDAFYASSHAFDVTEANGNTLNEAVILIDSAQENDRYLNVTKRLLTDYDASYDEFWGMVAAVNSTFTVYFRGHQVPAFLAAVKADRSHLTVLRDFAVQHDDLLGTDRSYLVYNAGRELGRFLQYADLKNVVRPLAKELLDRSQMTGRTARLWVGVAEMTDAYDKDNCSQYGTCDLANRVRDAVLTVKHTCGDTLRIVAQQMTAAELASSCESLREQDDFFHGVAKDQGPVADDHNTTLEVVAFDSSTDYQTYAGVVFGIDTNNGGMYLEGDPAQQGNLPRFIAYEAEWVRPEFQIWNLNHEYTHYLDGRFNMYGDFAAGQSTPTVMWVEGFAEYISYSYLDIPYEQAIEEAGKKTYKLSTLFDTTYENTDQTRTYQWGYLAVRYLLQSHPQDVAALLGHYRAGDWDAARTLLTSTIGNRYDADFDAWLDRCAAGDCGTPAKR